MRAVFLIRRLLFIAVILGLVKPVKASTRPEILVKPLLFQKTLDMSIGRGGIYFYRPNYSGHAVLVRIDPENTRKLTFTQRWSDISLFDVNGNSIETVIGSTYVYFVLGYEERMAWDEGKLSIYHYSNTEKIWEVCDTQLLARRDAPWGMVRYLITAEFGLYGLAIKR